MAIRGGPVQSITLFKDGGFTETDTERILQGYEYAVSHTKRGPLSSYAIGQDRSPQVPSQEHKTDPVEELRGLGIEVHQGRDINGKKLLTWDNLAGYSDVKKEIKQNILIPLQHPEVYDNIVKYTREHVERNRPKAILLEGPPGTVNQRYSMNHKFITWCIFRVKH